MHFIDQLQSGLVSNGFSGWNDWSDCNDSSDLKNCKSPLSTITAIRVSECFLSTLPDKSLACVFADKVCVRSIRRRFRQKLFEWKNFEWWATKVQDIATCFAISHLDPVWISKNNVSRVCQTTRFVQIRICQSNWKRKNRRCSSQPFLMNQLVSNFLPATMEKFQKQLDDIRLALLI